MLAENQNPGQVGQAAPVPATTGSLVTINFFNEAELAHMLGKSVKTLRRWHLARLGPPRISVGRMILYKKASVLAWLEAQEQRQLRRRG